MLVVRGFSQETIAIFLQLKVEFLLRKSHFYLSYHWAVDPVHKVLDQKRTLPFINTFGIMDYGSTGSSFIESEN